MWRAIGGVVVGIVVWAVVAEAIDLALRYSWPAYMAVEKSLAFTLPMMAARLTESGISSIVSGFAARKLGRQAWVPVVAGAIILALFLPVHLQIWNRLPIWYHLTFFVSLIVLSALGGLLARRGQR